MSTSHRSKQAVDQTQMTATAERIHRFQTQRSKQAVDKQTVDQTRMMVLSLKPRFAEAILSGGKSVELRRAKPRITVPTKALVYATTPVKAILGTCIVTRVVSQDVDRLWRCYGSRAGISRDEFTSYFRGVNTGTALILSGAERFDSRVSLADLRSSGEGFRPPRSFAYLDADRGNQLLAMSR